jgi:hypothetical protein
MIQDPCNSLREPPPYEPKALEKSVQAERQSDVEPFDPPAAPRGGAAPSDDLVEPMPDQNQIVKKPVDDPLGRDDMPARLSQGVASPRRDPPPAF